MVKGPINQFIMKIRFYAFMLLALFAGTTILFSCEKEDEPDSDPHALLYDKTWYSDGEGRGDHVYSKSGVLNVTYPNSPGLNYSGTFTWYPNSDSMRVDYGNNVIINYTFPLIGEHKMQYIPSNEAQNTYTFLDTKP